MKQGLLDVQANVLSTHCPLLGYSCRGYLMRGSASIPRTFKELLQLKNECRRAADCKQSLDRCAQDCLEMYQ